MNKITTSLCLLCLAASQTHAAVIYDPSDLTYENPVKTTPYSFTGSGQMPGLSDGSNAFFALTVNFSSFTFTENVTDPELPDHQVLFESGGEGKGVSLTLTSNGLLRFRTGSDNTNTETSVDLTSSGLSTGIDLNFVAAFNAAADTLDLYLNETSKTAGTTLVNTEIAGNDGYGVANFGGTNTGTFDASAPNDTITQLAFDAGTITNFVVYDDLSESLSTSPEPSAALLGGLGALLLLRRRR